MRGGGEDTTEREREREETGSMYCKSNTSVNEEKDFYSIKLNTSSS